MKTWKIWSISVVPLTRLFPLGNVNMQKVRGQGCAAALIMIPFYYRHWFLKYTEHSVKGISHEINSNSKQPVLVVFQIDSENLCKAWSTLTLHTGGLFRFTPKFNRNESKEGSIQSLQQIVSDLYSFSVQWATIKNLSSHSSHIMYKSVPRELGLFNISVVIVYTGVQLQRPPWLGVPSRLEVPSAADTRTVVRTLLALRPPLSLPGYHQHGVRFTCRAERELSAKSCLSRSPPAAPLLQVLCGVVLRL